MKKSRGFIILTTLTIIAIGGGMIVLAINPNPGEDGTLKGTFETFRDIRFPDSEMIRAIEDYPIARRRKFFFVLIPADPGMDGYPRWTIKEFRAVPRLLVKSWREVR